jgi:hypothetical protein
MTTSVIERSSTMAYFGLLLTVVAVFLLPWLVSVPPVLSIALGLLGFVMTMSAGRGIYSVLAGAVVAWSLIGLFTSNAMTADAPDLEEPIPVPSGYGFKLDPDSTNLEHMYDSRPMPAEAAESAAVEVVDYYVSGLVPEWTVVDRQERPDTLFVELREGESSRGISIGVYVVTPEGRPAVLDLRLQALLCHDDRGGWCGTAPITERVRYPSGDPVTSPEPQTQSLREPVPVPPGYGFELNAGLSSEQTHVYESSTQMSIPEARRAQRAVMRYYRRALDDWIVTATSEATLRVKDPDSTDGLGIHAHWVASHWGVVTLQISALHCPEDYWCT